MRAAMTCGARAAGSSGVSRRARFAIGAACLFFVGCSRGGESPAPPTSTTQVPPPSTTTSRLPKATGAPLPGIEAVAFHDVLAGLGLTTGPPSTTPGLVTTTSSNPDATVSTYGRGAGDVVKIVAEADSAAAAAVLVPVARAVTSGADDRKVEVWLRAQLRRGPISATQPRTARASYGGLPFDLIVNAATATLSVGDLSG